MTCSVSCNYQQEFLLYISMLGDSQAGVWLAHALQNSLNDLWKYWSENSLSQRQNFEISQLL